jgi:hypothetical protein
LTKPTPDNQPSSTENKPVVRWRCPNCGQTLFTAPDYEPPDICAYCRDMTTWQRVEDEDHQQHKS